jgi:CheY-like chemotaxis protein
MIELGNIHFMLIDDNKIDLFLHQKLLSLSNLGNEYSAYNSAEMALALLKENAKEANRLPDIILLDIQMPHMDGFEFLENFEQMRSELSKEISIYTLSSTADSNDINRLRNHPLVKRPLKKPLEFGLLLEDLIKRKSL